MPAGLVQDAADDIEAVGAAVEGEFWLGAAFARQLGHALRVDIGWIGDDQVVTPPAEWGEQVAPMQGYDVVKSIVGDVSFGDVERARGNIYRVDARIGKIPARQDREAARAGAEGEHGFDRRRI